MTDKFNFEWKAGDSCKYKGAKWKVVCYSDKYGQLHIAHGQHQVSVSSTSPEKQNQPKPTGKTKARYKSERLKWQQSRIKVGDWVKIINKNSDFFGVKTQVEDKSSLQSLTLFSCAYFGSSEVKPCKPPKPKSPVIETEHFRVDGNAIISKDCFNTNSIFDLDLRKYQEFPMSIHKVDNDCTQYLSANAHREIAEILDRLDSAR